MPKKKKIPYNQDSLQNKLIPKLWNSEGITSLEVSQQLFFLLKDYFDLRLVFPETCLTFFKLKFLIFRSISLFIFEAVDIWSLLTMA